MTPGHRLAKGDRVRVTLDVEGTVSNVGGAVRIALGSKVFPYADLRHAGAEIDKVEPPFGPGDLLEGPGGHLYHLSEEGYLFLRRDGWRRFAEYGRESSYAPTDFVEPRFRKATAP